MTTLIPGKSWGSRRAVILEYAKRGHFWDHKKKELGLQSKFEEWAWHCLVGAYT
jgi:hypothetical protein